MRGLLSQLFFLFLLLLPLMAAVLSGDLLAAYCRMRGETGRDCSLGEYLGSPEGWTELRHLAGKALPSYLMVLLVCGLLMLLVQVLVQVRLHSQLKKLKLDTLTAKRSFSFVLKHLQKILSVWSLQKLSLQCAVV